MTTPAPDRSRQMIYAILAILGVVLAIAGWYNWSTP
jgi:uncharacterized membrane protein YidH (DUF202 family)